MFNPERLKLARMRRKLTKKGLAEAVSLTPVTITRLEQGLNDPEPQTVDALAKTLNFPKDFFYGDDIEELHQEAASFRSLTSMTAKERNAAISSGRIGYLLSDWATSRFNLPDPDLIDLSYESDAAAAARTLRQYWGIGEAPISNMIKLLESKGVRIFSLSESSRNVDAFSCWRGDTPYVFLNTYKTAEHSRFDAAHELGHLVMHRHGGPNQGRAAERDANSFASAFLMPEADVISKVPVTASIDRLIQEKKRWRVSLSALAYRMHKIGLLSDWRYRSICIDINKRGYNASEPNGIEREESVVWKTIFNELWSERITKSHIASDLCVPLDDIECLVFGLVGTMPSKISSQSEPKLKLIKDSGNV